MLNSFEKTKKENICFKGFQRPQENQQIEFQGNHNIPMHTHAFLYVNVVSSKISPNKEQVKKACTIFGHSIERFLEKADVKLSIE